MVTILQPCGASLGWKQCTKLPVGMVDAQTVQLKTEVYVQGQTNSLETACTIYVYEASVDRYLRVLAELCLCFDPHHLQLTADGGGTRY